jgi:predicted nucleotide-binding protein (sugar kinase/HSP70/actin superfamily)
MNKEKKARKALWKKLKDENYLILIPAMLPIHFRLLSEVLTKFGYRTKMMEVSGREVKDEGLRNVQNDACYPALLVVGQFMCELKSGKYDLDHTAIMMSQTGGGCRASNYISLIRKSIGKEFPNVPVLSFNFSGLEKTTSLPFTPRLVLQLCLGVLYGDMLMLLYNQTRPYETEKGQADRILEECSTFISTRLKEGGFYNRKKNYKHFVDAFSEIKIPAKRKPRVGIVGEIYVKYSALANNDLVNFLIEEGTEPFQPSLLEFCLYCILNVMNDYKFYKIAKFSHLIYRMAYKIAYKESLRQTASLKGSQFLPYDDFEEIRRNTSKIISQGVKMGEGWLIPSEMVTMAETGIEDIVCCQPFGCLPNHIVGKGMIRPIKALYPKINIAAIDYDPGATKVNQENRIKLMLSNLDRRD